MAAAAVTAVAAATAAMASAAAAAAPAGAVAAAKAAGLMLVNHEPARTAENDDRNNDRRQVKVGCQKFHHKKSLLSEELADIPSAITWRQQPFSRRT